MQKRVWAIGLGCMLLAGQAAAFDSGEKTEAAENMAVQDTDPAEIAIGERLFLETRFSRPATIGGHQPADRTATAMSCASCHLVDQQLEAIDGGMRSYADFADRPPVPDRTDRGNTDTVAARNSQSLVGVSRPAAERLLLHYDGEFASMPELVKATLTGRNHGWLADERAQAIHHVARVVREDDGTGDLAKEFGGSYRRVLAGTDPGLPAAFQLPEAFRINIETASDEAIVLAVSQLIAAYVDDLAFSTNAQGVHDGSPYDLFLQVNQLPAAPGPGESPQHYATRLLSEINQRSDLKLIADDGETRHFEFHDQDFAFGADALAGLKIFLATPGQMGISSQDGISQQDNPQQSIGNCVSCHQLPHFSDFSVHNTGVSQQEYDEVHEIGAFMSLTIPDLATRNDGFDDYLPATLNHPNARGRMRAIPSAGDPGLADLGAWNIFANPDKRSPQAALRRQLCELNQHASCSDLNDDELLSLSIATFKTPQLRDLGHSSPFMHNGRFPTIDSVVQFYRDMSMLARAGQLRNPDPQILGIRLNEEDVDSLAAFLKSLNEDYE